MTTRARLRVYWTDLADSSCGGCDAAAQSVDDDGRWMILHAEECPAIEPGPRILEAGGPR